MAACRFKPLFAIFERVFVLPPHHDIVYFARKGFSATTIWFSLAGGHWGVTGVWHVIYRFDDFLVDPERRELTRAGQPVAVEPQVFSLLVHLLENRDRAVSKDELVEAIWDGRFVSDSAISSRIKSARKALGDDGRSQKYIKTIHRHGFRFAGHSAVQENNAVPQPVVSATDAFIQDIRFCMSADGTKIANAVAGEGPPLVKTANWLNHLDFDWQSPVWRHVFSDLMQHHQLIRYDARGNGLSDWNVSDYSLARQIEDLEAVVETLELDRFPLFGVSQGCAVSAAYAAKHPDRVTKLVLLGGYATGWRVRATPLQIEENSALISLIRTGWGRDHPGFRQTFTSLFMPDAPPDNQNWFNELQRKTTSPENAAQLLDTLGDVDVREYLPSVQAPTLVLHCRGDMRVPLDAGRELASGIKNARFVMLETNNHLMPQTDPAWRKCSEAINAFLTS